MKFIWSARFFDPLGRPTITAGSDHCFHTCCPSVRTSVPNFQNLAKPNKFQATVGLAEWIINGTRVLFLHLFTSI